MKIGKKTVPRVEINLRPGQLSRPRYHYRLPGLAPPVDFRVPNNNMTNLKRAVLERVFYVKDKVTGNFSPPPKPLSGVFEQRTSMFLGAVKKHLSPTIPITHEDFVGLYKDRRKMIYEQARLSLLDKPWSKRDAVCQSFVKADKLNTSEKPDPAPRLIQPRSPRFNVVVGSFLKPIEHRVYRAINKAFRYPTVMKGYNANQTGRVIAAKWNAFKQAIGITIDATRFDQHIHGGALKLAHEVYLWIYRNHKKILQKMLDEDFTTTGKCFLPEGILKYFAGPQRISGSMDTAMGNIIVMTAMLFDYLEQMNIQYQVINNGDDSTIFIEAADEHKLSDLQAYFLTLGFTMKIENVARELEKVVFCQTQPIWTPDGYRMTRDPHVCLAKDTTCLFSFTSPTSLGKYCQVFGAGGLSLASGIPILQAFYQMFLRVPGGEESKVTFETGMAFSSHGMESKVSPIHPQTRYSFWRAFGITPDEQVCFENHYHASSITWDGLRDPNRQNFPQFPPNITV